MTIKSRKYIFSSLFLSMFVVIYWSVIGFQEIPLSLIASVIIMLFDAVMLTVFKPIKQLEQ